MAALWLLARYKPTALFSLKLSFATSSVGKTSPVPTPYAIKMALVDCAFRVGDSEDQVRELVRLLRTIGIRISPPKRAVITNTFVKVRQEPKDPTPEEPYGSSIAYRELVHHDGEWRWAFDISEVAAESRTNIERLSRHVSYIGKRGSFVQFAGTEEVTALDDSFTQPLEAGATWNLPRNAQVLTLDDFGPEAELDVLSSFSSKRAQRGKHRRFVDTIVPLQVLSTGPGFTDYELST